LKSQIDNLYLSRFKHLSKYIAKNKGNKSSNTPEDDSDSESSGSHKRIPLFISPRNPTSKSPRFTTSYLSGDEGSKSAHPKINISQFEHPDDSVLPSPTSVEIFPKGYKNKSKKGKHSSDKKLKKTLPIEKRKSTETSKSKNKFKERLKTESDEENSD